MTWLTIRCEAIMQRKGAKTNQAESGNCNSKKSYMVQDKVDQGMEQVVESVEEITSPQ